MFNCFSQNLIFSGAGLFGFNGGCFHGYKKHHDSPFKNILKGMAVGVLDALCFRATFVNPFFGMGFLCNNMPDFTFNSVFTSGNWPLNFDSFNNYPSPNSVLNGFNSGSSDFGFKMPDYNYSAFGFGGMGFNLDSYIPQVKVNNSASPVANSGGNQADGVSQTVAGVDYSVFGNASDRIKKLRPEMQKKVEMLFKYAKGKGWDLTLTSGFRSTAEQEKLYKEYQAKLKKGQHPSPVAEPGKSRHEYGCAVDLKIGSTSANSDPRMKDLGAYAKSIGMRWGGDWKGDRRECWHFEINPA